MSFINNLKGIAEKATEEIKKAAEETTNHSEVIALPDNSIMNGLKDITSKANKGIQKANEEIKKHQVISGDDLSSRHKMNEQELQSAWQRAEEQMNEELSSEVECYLQDIILPDEHCFYKIRNSCKGSSSQIVLIDRCLYIVNKGIRGGQAQDCGDGIIGAALAIGQVSIRIYPIKEISFVEIHPMKGLTRGHLQVFTLTA